MYKKVPVKKLTGNEFFKNTKNKKFSVLEFWQYGFSSLNSNVLRGALAEFLVENALKDKKDILIRNPWGDYDVETNDKKKIEVKCSSYIQDWDQDKLSTIYFSGLKAKEIYWSEAVKKRSDLKERDYKADIYILALLDHQEPTTLDILDIDQWSFYVLTKDRIKEITKDGNSISLSKLNKNNIKPYHFNQLANIVTNV